jgi:hypothetical protein
MTRTKKQVQQVCRLQEQYKISILFIHSNNKQTKKIKLSNESHLYYTKNNKIFENKFNEIVQNLSSEQYKILLIKDMNVRAKTTKFLEENRRVSAITLE